MNSHHAPDTAACARRAVMPESRRRASAARPALRTFAAALMASAVVLACAASPAFAEGRPQAGQGFAGFGGADSKEPIKIDSDRLDVFDQEKKAVFAGNVIAVQGETTMRCKTLTVFYEQGVSAQGTSAQPAAPQGAGMDNGVRRLECAGPMTVVSRDQVASADQAIYDKAEQKVYLNGNARLSQGENVTTGDRLVYDLATSRASVERKPGQRVRALLVPGGENGAQPQPKPAGR